MGMLEKINEINKNLSDMIATKAEIKNVLEKKFGKPIGDDFTKYPQKIDEVFVASDKIKVKKGQYFFSQPETFTPIWDFSECTYYNHLCKEATFPEKPLEEKIELNLRNCTSCYATFYGKGNEPIEKFFKLVGISKAYNNDFKTFIDDLFDYADRLRTIDGLLELDEEKDLKGNKFYMGYCLRYVKLNNVKKFPDWFLKCIPYSNDFSDANSSSTINLSDDVELEFCKEQSMDNNSSGCVFSNMTAPNIHLYFHNDISIDTTYSFFMNGGCPGTIRIDGPGSLIFKNSYNSDSTCINKIANQNFVGNRLEVKFKTGKYMTRDQDFSNFKDVRFLEGSEFYSVSNLPYTTQEEWVDFFNSLPDNSASNYQNIININSEYYNLLSEDDLYIATDKGFTITSV